jgi:hypothetical protein
LLQYLEWQLPSIKANMRNFREINKIQIELKSKCFELILLCVSRALLANAHAKGLKVITATGAGGKADPTRIHIGTLHDAVRDPLATKIRYIILVTSI